MRHATPLFVWPNHTGVTTMTYVAVLRKWLAVVVCPTDADSTVGSFDTAFLEVRLRLSMCIKDSQNEYMRRARVISCPGSCRQTT